MMRPPAFPFGIGTDICHVPRIYRILTSSKRGPKFIERILTPEERQQRRVQNVLEYIPVHKAASASRLVTEPQLGQPILDGLEPRDQKLWKAAQFIAGRFAAKEAVIKAHTDRRLTFQQISIQSGGGGDGQGGQPESAPSDEDTVAATGAPPPPPLHHHHPPSPPSPQRQKEEQPPAADEDGGGGSSGSGSAPPVALVKAQDPASEPDRYASISISHDGDYATAVCLAYLEHGQG